jgi:hypothetical protein
MAWSEQDDNRVRELCKTIDVGKLTSCPKCGMGQERGEMMLVNFCTHKYCPFRDWRHAREAEDLAERQKGIPRRIDCLRHTPAEKAITEAMYAVEHAGASTALSDAVTLLAKARDRVADHVDAEIEAAKTKK